MTTNSPTLRRDVHGGFTLVELLIAIALMALMAALSWRGLDGMTRAQTRLSQRSDDVFALQAGLAQWGTDLDALAEQPGTTNLLWDGRALRILRHGPATPGAGLRVVAWSHRNIDGIGQWLRWQSGPVTTRGDLQIAWKKAGDWSKNPSDEDRKREVRVIALDQWQLFYYFNDAWSNPLSSGVDSGQEKLIGSPIIPKAIRLVLSLPPDQAISGTLTRDWLNPDVGGEK